MTFLNKLPQRARLGKIFARYLLVIAISKCQTCPHTLFFGRIWQVGKLRERKKKEKKKHKLQLFQRCLQTICFSIYQTLHPCASDP